MLAGETPSQQRPSVMLLALRIVEVEIAMKGYWIAHVTVTDPDQYKVYAEGAGPAFRKYNARILARGGKHAQLEGAGRPRNVVIEFPSFEKAIACYNSPEYQEARAKRAAAGSADIVVVEGVE